MKIRFVISTSIVGSNREIIEEVPDDMTDGQLREYAEELVWEYINVSYDEISE